MKVIQTRKVIDNSPENFEKAKKACEDRRISRIHSEWRKIPDLSCMLKMMGYTLGNVDMVDPFAPVIEVVLWYGHDEDEAEAAAILDEMDDPEPSSGTVYRQSDIEYLARRIHERANGGVDMIYITDRQFRQSIDELCVIIAMRNQLGHANPTDDLEAVLRDPYAASIEFSSRGTPEDNLLPQTLRQSLVGILSAMGLLQVERQMGYTDSIDHLKALNCFAWLSVYAKDVAGVPVLELLATMMDALIESGEPLDLSAFSPEKL